jgi:zinc transport system ATP-binding protein
MSFLLRHSINMNLISLQNVTVAYGNSTVLRYVDLEIKSHEIVTIVGPNGSGKTSLLKAIIGALSPVTGTVRVKPGLKIGYLPQRLNFDPALPITVNRFMRLAQKVDKNSCMSALESAGVPQLAQSQMSDLSGGQFQRVLLARSLLGKPEILILDEATQGLDQPGSAAFYRQIEKVRNETGCAVLMISHDLHVVMSASDRVICLNGHICCAGTPAAVISAPEYQKLFGTGTDGALALYRHQHDHVHEHDLVATETVESC